MNLHRLRDRQTNQERPVLLQLALGLVLVAGGAPTGLSQEAESPAAVAIPREARQKQGAPPQPEPAQAPQPAPPPAQPAGEAAIALNLENADLYQVLRIIGTELRINYVIDPAVKGTVNINTAGQVTRADLFSLLQTILHINGAMAVKTDGYYRIVPVQDAKQLPLPLVYAKEPEAPPAPEQPLTLHVQPMRFVAAAEMSKILTPFMSAGGQIVIQEQGNILLIMETPAKLRQLGEIIGLFDSPVFSRQRVKLFPVTNNLAKNIISELQSIFSGYGLSASASAIRFLPLERLNAILAISPAPEVFAEVEEWIRRLDQPTPDVGLRNFVYMVQNAKASDLRDILIELYGGQVPRPQAVPQVTEAAPSPLVPAQAAPAKAPEAPARIQGEIRVLADEKNNALIIQATSHDYEIIERTIKELDILPRQVLIDAKIYEVALTGDLSLGLSAFLDRRSKLPLNPVTTGSFAAGQPGGSFLASTFALIGNTRALQVFLTAEENRTRIRTLSAPSILVTDNTDARIQVGSEVPVPIGSALTPIESGGTSLFAQTIQFRNTGVILTVTPRINASGIVTLHIEQEVSTAIPNATSQIVAPVINKSSFKTSVVLRDGETLALGGIITESHSLAKNRVPLLGDIPGLGLLFGSTSRRTARTELVLLLTPHVIHNIPQAVAVTEEFTNRLREVKKAMQQFK